MVLRQQQPPTADFVDAFQETIIPSAIPSSEFIDWDDIEAAIKNYEPQIEAIRDLEDTTEQAFIDGLADALMDADDTRKWIDFYFEILGERGNKYSAREGLWKFYDVQRAIDSGTRTEAVSLAEVLQEMGLQYVVDRVDIRDHYRGMLVGMETHARKNRQGTCFENAVESALSIIIDTLSENGYSAELEAEYTTAYNDQSGQKKTVDFAVFVNDRLAVVVEANCYKGGGSKPSEIRRSYNHVASRMRADDVEFVWVTDGQGWAKSLTNVLRQSYEDITDVYNLHQVEHELGDDILAYVESEC
ncbi:DpnII family type II restriction endonuclease [Halorubellus sp. PRR65]|uniref:DpnII family type II restriction endonuclease n=1 Tax=Halorubellus sp. PRR65 TaxID=3098148 RepID=UPI002B25EA9E|nr:DpnII family type II restriction endonuclease [Halorubellus sp. PRR65]